MCKRSSNVITMAEDKNRISMYQHFDKLKYVYFLTWIEEEDLPIGSLPYQREKLVFCQIHRSSHYISETKPINQNGELVVDFVSNKMNDAWIGLKKANKIDGVGLKHLSRVKPWENFFKSITKDVSTLHITYPSSGTVNHKKYLYGCIALLAPAATLAILPLQVLKQVGSDVGRWMSAAHKNLDGPNEFTNEECCRHV